MKWNLNNIYIMLCTFKMGFCTFENFFWNLTEDEMKSEQYMNSLLGIFHLFSCLSTLDTSRARLQLPIARKLQ